MKSDLRFLLFRNGFLRVIHILLSPRIHRMISAQASANSVMIAVVLSNWVETYTIKKNKSTHFNVYCLQRMSYSSQCSRFWTLPESRCEIISNNITKNILIWKLRVIKYISERAVDVALCSMHSQCLCDVQSLSFSLLLRARGSILICHKCRVVTDLRGDSCCCCCFRCIFFSLSSSRVSECCSNAIVLFESI